MASNSLSVAFSTHTLTQKHPRKESGFFCIWFQAKKTQEHNNYPGICPLLQRKEL